MEPVGGAHDHQPAFDAAVRHYQSGRMAEAEAACRRILATAPDHAGTLHLLGVIAHRRGHPQAAVDLIGRAISRSRQNPVADFHANIALAHRALGQLDLAIDHFRRVTALMPRHAEAHFNLGVLLRQANRLEEAATSFRRAIALKTNHLGANNGLGIVFMSLGKPGEALPYFQTIARHDPNVAEAHGNLGNALLGIGRLDEAVVAYRRAAALKPGDARTHGALGETLERLGQFDAAVASYEKALALRPDFVEALNNLGNVLTKQNDPDQANVYFQRALAIQPDNAVLHYNVGNALRDLGEADEAIAHYRRAIVLKPDYSQAHVNLGNLLNLQSRLDEATESFRQALALTPADVNAHINLGNTLLDQGGRDEALGLADAAETCEIVLPLTHYLLGVFLARCGLGERAAVHLNASLAGDPQDPSGARLALAALGAAPIPATASTAHLDRVYADRASSWDRTVSGKFPYRGAELVAGCLSDVAGRGKLDILDAGCGTGLVGDLVRKRASRLDGVDLSAAMIDRATEKNAYDHLHRGDIVDFMNDNPGRYDAVTCAATLIHFGDLRAPFEAAANALRDDGWFVLTLFPNDNEGVDTSVAAFDGLAQGGCYTHSRAYIARAADAAGFDVGLLNTEIHEYYRGAPRDGLVVALRRRSRATV